jgi:hypothetical protein
MKQKSTLLIAPYYMQEQTTWTKITSGFTTQHALVLFDVNGLLLMYK